MTRSHWHRQLSPGRRASLYITSSTLAFLLLCLGGAAVVGAVTGGPDPDTTDAGRQRALPRSAATAATDRSSPAAAATTSPPPVVEQRTETETESIPFATTTVEDPALAKGTTKIRTRGVPGVKTLTYQVTVTDGVVTDRRLVSESVTKAPVNQVVAVGTKQATDCDPNYDGCVPIASDVDCAGGSGNGPAYVKGPVRVIGKDIYGLDADHDGIGCE